MLALMIKLVTFTWLILQNHIKATEKQLVYNEIYPPVIEKQKIIDPYKRSGYELLEQYSSIEKGNPRSYRATKKAHATLFKK